MKTQALRAECPDDRVATVAWFAALDDAVVRGDWRRASDAERELERLGYVVRSVRPMASHLRPAREEERDV